MNPLPSGVQLKSSYTAYEGIACFRTLVAKPGAEEGAVSVETWSDRALIQEQLHLHIQIPVNRAASPYKLKG